VEGGEDEGKGGRRVNMVQILCNMFVNCKMVPVEIVSGMWRRRENGNDGRGDIL
jgi:hypothetical protein